MTKGTYYFYDYADYYYREATGNFNVKLMPVIKNIGSFKVSSRNTTSLKLSWNKVAGVSGKKYFSDWTYLTTPTKPAKPSIKTPSTNKKHQITAKWKKISRCSGYQVQYSRKKNFSKVIATKTVSGSSKTSYTGKNFTKGKKYYVRVRSYKTVNGTKYYSAWSNVKSIKCK